MDFGQRVPIPIAVGVIVVAMGLAALAILAPELFQTRRVGPSRAQSDMRVLATAIEAYRVDHGEYPAMAIQVDPARIAVPTAEGVRRVAGASVDRGATKANRGRTFRAVPGPGSLVSLTTPVTYITHFAEDPFADTRGLSFRYHTDGVGWIVGSFGPDRDEATVGDLPWEAPLDAGRDGRGPGSMEAAYWGRIAQPSLTLLTGSSGRPRKGAYTYDPSNGTLSQGDLYRIANR